MPREALRDKPLDVKFDSYQLDSSQEFAKQITAWNSLEYEALRAFGHKVFDLFSGEHNPQKLNDLWGILKFLEFLGKDQIDRKKSNKVEYQAYLDTVLKIEDMKEYQNASPIKMLEGLERVFEWANELQSLFRYLKPIKKATVDQREGVLE